TAKAPKRKWNDMVDEFRALRTANMAFFASLDEEQLLHTGTANNNVMSVVALGFVSAGHVAHHMNIISERYLDKNTGGKERKADKVKAKQEKKLEKKVQKEKKKAGKSAQKAAIKALK